MTVIRFCLRNYSLSVLICKLFLAFLRTCGTDKKHKKEGHKGPLIVRIDVISLFRRVACGRQLYAIKPGVIILHLQAAIEKPAHHQRVDSMFLNLHA